MKIITTTVYYEGAKLKLLAWINYAEGVFRFQLGDIAGAIWRDRAGWTVKGGIPALDWNVINIIENRLSI